MEKYYCTVCKKEVDEGDRNVCLACGEVACEEDYDNISGYCTNCVDNCPYCGC